MSNNYKHLILSDRIYIEQCLNERKTFSVIGRELGRDPTTISKEVRRFLAWRDGWVGRKRGNDCKNFSSCTIDDICVFDCISNSECKICKIENCNSHCPHFVPAECPELKNPPYVCNGCPEKNSCVFTQYYYDAQEADKRYQTLLSESRIGINTDEQTLFRVNRLITPLIRKGQPLSHIIAVHRDEIPMSRSTVYNYLDQGLFDVRNIDLPRRVRYKLRKKRRQENPVNYDYRRRRTYKDFEKYIEAFPDYEVVETDTVKGTRESGKCLLTLLFRHSNFMLIFLLQQCKQEAIRNVFAMLYEGLGSRTFKKTFRIILTDNDPEFKDPWSIEKAPDGSLRTKVFYCDPYASNQKEKIERNHEFIRYIIPKGRSMYNLTDEDVRKMMCHINSVARGGLNGATPFDMAELLISKKVLHLLGLRKNKTTTIHIF